MVAEAVLVVAVVVVIAVEVEMEVEVEVGGLVVLAKMVEVGFIIFLGRQAAFLVMVVVKGVTEQPVAVVVVDGEQVVVVVMEPSWV